MTDLNLIEPTYLYTLLNQYLFYSKLSNPKYLLLLDARSKEDYNDCHIIMAKRMKTNFQNEFLVPFDSELECQENVVVYDADSDSLNQHSLALKGANVILSNGARNGVLILKGGYKIFSALYPFLRSEKIIWIPRELDAYYPFPLEVIPQFLYLGNSYHSMNKNVQKQLKIKAHVNCTLEPNEIFIDHATNNLFEINVSDDFDSDIGVYFDHACAFIDKNRDENKRVLVYSNLGISRGPTIIMAYLMKKEKYNLKEAWAFLKNICTLMRPNRGFVKALSDYEVNLNGKKITIIDDPDF